MSEFDQKANPEHAEFFQNPGLTPDMKWCDVPGNTTLYEIMCVMGAPTDFRTIVKNLKPASPGILNMKKEKIDEFFAAMANTKIQRFERAHDVPSANRLRHALQSLPQMSLAELNSLTLDEWLDSLFTRKQVTFILEKSTCELAGDFFGLALEYFCSASSNAEENEMFIEPLEEVCADKFDKPLLASIIDKLCEAEKADAAAKAAKRAMRIQTVRDGAKSFGTGVAAFVGHVGKSRFGTAVIAAFGEAAAVGRSFLDGLTSNPATTPDEEDSV